MKQKVNDGMFYSFLLAALLLALALPVEAQDAIKVTADEHEHVFKKSLTFRLSATSSSEIDTIKLFYRVSGQTSTNKVDLEFEPGKTVSAGHTVDMSEQENYQPPMIEFTYWWVIEDEANNRLKTEAATFVYEDTNYTWQSLESDLIRLYWHDQDQEWGQHFFDLAVETAGSLHDEFGVAAPRPVQIVIYNSHEELMDVLQEASSEWTGAVTFGETGCIAIGLGTMDWMNTVIPHELTHATLYMITKPPFGDIPRWLHEGLAMRSEGGMGFEEKSTLASAIEDDTLIALRVLNSSFPDERERAILSYAESYSLIDFIVQKYGTEKLGELIAVFAQGAHYDDALKQVFGVDMDGMEDLWREFIGARPREGSTRATPASVSTPTAAPTATRPVPTPTKKIDLIKSPTPTPVATAAATQPTLTATAVENRADPTTTSRPTPQRGPCLGAAVALAVALLFALLRPQARPH